MSDVKSLFDLSRKVAIVTGGAGLLGAEFCKALFEAGAHVIVADVLREAADDLAASLTGSIAPGQQGQQYARAVYTDITSPDSVRKLFMTAVAEFGGVDILVNSAAIDPKFDSEHLDSAMSQAALDQKSLDNHAQNLPFENFPLELWNQALEVNLTGMFLCCQAAAREMVKQGKGVIINVCSIYGLVGPDQRLYQRPGKRPAYKPVYYSVTKAGVLGLTRYLATYYAGKGIRVNALTPGGVFNGHDQDFVQAYSARTVLGRMAEKNELNGALIFLASDASSYMTGANLIVDGGWTAW